MKNSKQKKNAAKEEEHLDDATRKARAKKADQKKKRDDKLNRELKESFPASDPPSSIQPGSGAHRD